MRKLVHLTLLLCLFQFSANAANKYWVAAPFSFDWNLPVNWSLTPTLPYVPTTAPGAGDVAIFPASLTGNFLCIIGTDVTVQAIDVAGYGGTILFSGGTLTLTGTTGAGGPAAQFGIRMNSGLFTNATSTSTIDCQSNFLVTAGNFTGSAGSTTIFGGNFTIGAGATYTGADQSITIFRKLINGPATVTLSNTGNSVSLFDVTVDNSAAGNDILNIAAADTLEVRGNLLVEAGSINGANAAIKLQGNFTGQDAFTASSVNVFFTGGANQNFSLENTADAGNLNGGIFIRQDPVSTVTLLSPLLIDNPGQVVTFNSGIVLSSAANTLQFTDGTSAASASNDSYVDGPVQKSGISGFTFPIGDDGYWGAISISGAITFESAFASSVTHVAQYFHVNPDLAGYPHTSLSPFAIANNFKVSECEYWNMQRTAGTEDPVIWLSFDSDRSCGITAPNNLAVMAWIPPLTSYWEATGGVFTGSPVNFRRSIGPVNFLSGIYTLGTNNPIANPLPVRWLSFTGRYFNAAVELNWSTSLEQNNDMFTVERSADGINYSAIGTVKGRGNASTTSVYNFVDPRPLSGTGHYRIKQTDRDGKISYSDVIRVSSSSPSMRGLRLFPNPAAGNIPLTLENSSWTNKKVNVTIFNAVGGIVYQDQVTFGADGRSKVNISSLQKGSYFVSTYLNGEKQTMPFLVQ